MKFRATVFFGIAFVLGAMFVLIEVALVIPGVRPFHAKLDLAGRNRMLTQRYVKEAMMESMGAGGGGGSASTARLFKASLDGLERGGSLPLGVEGGSPALISGEMSEEALLKLRRVAAQWEALEGAAGTLRGERPGSRGYAEAAARLDAAGERVLVSMDGVVKAISAQAEWEAAALKILQFVLAALFLSIGSLAYRYIVTADRLREAMRRMVADEKFAAIGKMSGMVAHELRNPLAAADSSCYIIERIAQADERVAAHVDRIRKAISKCTDVIESMRRLGKLDPLRLEEVEIEWLFEEALRMVETGGLVEVEIDVDPGMRVSVDASHFIIALRNVKANAVQAMPEGGALKLGAKRLEGKVVISVEDSGVGLHDHQLEKMFDPLYSTKENGFGLGLSIVKMIVDMHGGEINVQSRRGSGTAFNIAIPA